MINALPSNLSALVERIEIAIKAWPIHITLDHAIKWVLQFDADDYSLAVKIIENLDVLGSPQIRSTLEVAHTKLVRKISEKGSPMKGNNTLFAAIGSSAKSGALIAYHYRVTADIPEDNFVSSDEEDQLDLSEIENIVLVDDVIGSGRTIAKEVSRVAEEVYSLSRSRNIFILTVAGYEDGIKHVTEKTGASVVTALEYNTKDTVSNFDATFYRGMPHSERIAALETIKRYCRAISTSSLGFSELGGLLVFDHNTPNTTLPIIWSNSKGWLPLFPRAAKIVGAAKVLKSAENEREKTANTKSTTTPEAERKSAELTLFVEGKVDEIFVDYFISKQSLTQKIEVGTINAVALGGLHQSQKLISLLRDSKKHAIFVLDNDIHAKRASARLNDLNNVHVMHLNPSFISMLDVEKIYTNKERFPDLPETISGVDDAKWLHEVEMATLRKGGVSANSDRIVQLIDEFLDMGKYEEFCSSLKNMTDNVFSTPSKPKDSNNPPCAS